MPLRALAPAGTRIRAPELLRWLARSARPELELEHLREAFRNRYGAKNVLFFASGRALLSLALESLPGAARPAAPSVIIPAYTCHSVAASVVRAGFRVHPVDIDPRTLDYDRAALERVDTERVLAVLSSNLYGIPNDLEWLEQFAHDRSIALLDDAAQAMDATWDGRPVGTYGSAGLFSLDKGKNITTIQGGVLLVQDSELGARVERRIRDSPGPPVLQVAKRIVELVAYTMLLRPRLYWIPDRLLDLGETPWSPPTPYERYSGRLAPMAALLLDRIETFTEARITRASRLIDLLDEKTGSTPEDRVFIPGHRRSTCGSRAVYPRLPVLLPTSGARERVLDALRSERLGGSRSYPCAIVDIPEVQPHLASASEDTPTARSISERIITLPTHSYVTEADLDKIAEIVFRTARPR